MFGPSYFGTSYWGPTYFPPGGLGGIAGAALQLLWDDRALAAEGFSVLWDAEEEVGLSVTSVWDLFSEVSVVGDQLVLRWDSAEEAGTGLSGLWDLLSATSAVSEEVVLRWDIQEEAGGGVSVRWDLASFLQAVGDSINVRWDTVEEVQRSLGKQWDLLSSVSSTGDGATLRWDVFEEVSLDSTTLWDVLSLISQSGASTSLMWTRGEEDEQVTMQTAPTSRPIANLADLMTLLPIRAGNKQFDDRLVMLLQVATDQIEKHTRRFFTRQQFVEQLNVRDNSDRVLSLDSSVSGSLEPFRTAGTAVRVREQRIPLGSVPVDVNETIEVRYSTVRDFSEDDTVVSSGLYSVDGENGVLFYRGATLRGYDTLQVTYTGGYTSSYSVTDEAAWDDDNVGPGVTLSESDLVATSDGTSPGHVRADVGASSGKFVFEVLIEAGASNRNTVGIVRVGANLSADPGHDASGWGYRGQTGRVVVGGVESVYGSTYDVGDTVTCYFDADVGAAWFAINGTLQGGATIAEIEAGTTTNAAFTGITGTVYPAFGGPDALVYAGRTNFGGSALVGALPTGFAPGYGELKGEPSLSATVDEDLKLAAVVQAQYLFKKLDTENVGLGRDRRQGGETISYLVSGGLTPEAATLINKYRQFFRGTG